MKYVASRGLSFREPAGFETESYNERLESVVNSELERYMIEVRDILMKNAKLLDRITEELMQRRYLLFSEIQRIEKECGLVKTEVLC